VDNFEFNIEPKLRPSVERKLTGHTQLDTDIATLELPTKPITVKLLIFSLRVYRKLAPKAIRCRCVFDPSCSHYSELALRQHGVIKGITLTYKRLARCKPSAGGIDFLYLKKGE